MYITCYILLSSAHVICSVFQYIQQIVYKCIQWHVEECSVALLCN
jgi:hypothetical protein